MQWSSSQRAVLRSAGSLAEKMPSGHTPARTVAAAESMARPGAAGTGPSPMCTRRRSSISPWAMEKARACFSFFIQRAARAASRRPAQAQQASQ